MYTAQRERCQRRLAAARLLQR